MRIGIDLQVLSNQQTGIGNYAFNLARELLKIKTGHEFVLFFSNSVILNEVKNLARSFGQSPQDVKFILLPDKQLPFWFSHIIYARIMEKAKLDVMHGVANSLPLGFKGGNGGKGSKGLITVHDLAIYRHPEWFPRGQWLATKIVVPRSIKKADKIIVPSQATARDLKELFKVLDEKIAVVPHGVEERFFRSSVIPAKAGIQDWIPNQVQDDKEKGYILFVGTIEPRKNVERLIWAYQGLPEELKNEYELWIVGGRGWEEKKSRHSEGNPEESQRSFGVPQDDSIKFLDYVRDEDLPGLYQNASLFVYPSLYEGFGMPVLEAMAGGVPIITSQDTAMEEIAGSCAVYVDPYSVDSIRKGMEQVLGEMARPLTPERSDGGRGGRGAMLAKGFSWGQTVQETLEVYESL